MKILVTGFEPWGEHPHNPSGDVVASLAGERIGGAELVTAILPVVYGEDTAVVFPLMDVHDPAAVLSFGLGIAPCLNVEHIAINLRHDGTPILDDGPDAYFATIPTARIRDAIQAGGVPARISYHAGAFLCNHIMYSVLHRTGKRLPSGFIHVPPTPEMAASNGKGEHSMGLETIRKGAVLAIENLVAYLDNPEVDSSPGGSEGGS